MLGGQMLDVAGALRVVLARKAALCSVAWPRACTVPEGTRSQ